MWWDKPVAEGFVNLFPENILDLLVRCYAIVEVGGLSGCGPERGRNFENLFYSLCQRRGVYLTEKAGSTSLAEQRSASGLRHEVDGGARDVTCVTHWELKHLTTKLEKNELLIFNSKSLDFLQGSSQFYAGIPMRRFLLSGQNIRDDCRHYAALWGIAVIEPARLPLPLIYEATARGAAESLSEVDCHAVRNLAVWSCRSLQTVLHEIEDWCRGVDTTLIHGGPDCLRAAKSAADLQEQVGASVIDYLDDLFPDWVDEAAEEIWRQVGGW